jgi:hypothetical protein
MAATAVVSILRPVSEEAETRKADAKRHWATITKSGVLVGTNSLRIGFHAYALKSQGMFGILGFENEKEAQEASGVGDSTWYAMLNLAEKFNGVSEELFCGMRQANAKALKDLPESKRLTEYWLRRAATDSMDTFKALIDTEMDGKARESDGKERTVSLAYKMTKSQKSAIETGLKEIAKEFGCEGNDSRTIELLVAEKTGSVSLIAVLTNAVQRCKKVKELIESGIMSSDEILSQIVILNEEAILEMAEALQNLESGE